MQLEIQVVMPRFWWRARPRDLARWVEQDPDSSDGRQRWPDRGEQRWPLIAAAVAAVGEQLAAGAWTDPPDTDETPHRAVMIDIKTDLTATESKIINAWFRFEPVKADPWHEWPTNGRHRLWATRPHFGEQLIPVASHVLPCANPDDYGSLPDWVAGFRRNAEKLDRVSWFDASDPVNQRYRAALDSACRGKFPLPD